MLLPSVYTVFHGDDSYAFSAVTIIVTVSAWHKAHIFVWVVTQVIVLV
jgi:hypothetical protein